MIGRIDIRANAAHPNFPLPPVYMFAGAPSSPRVFGVPCRVGSWAITAVKIVVAYPDNSTRTVTLTQTDGMWIGVIPACATTGAVQNGVQIVADGTDENGDAVTGYCLGVGDLFVMERDFTATAAGTRYYFHYCEEAPATPQVGDAVYADGSLKWWDGTAWRDFGGPSITIDPSLSPTSENPVQNKAVAAALAAKLDGAAAYPAWDSTAHYLQGTVVSHGGRLWKAKRDIPYPPPDAHEPPPDYDDAPWDEVFLKDLKQDALSSAQMAAVNSGATAAKVTEWDGYAAQIAAKANASDLPYAMVTPGEWEFSGVPTGYEPTGIAYDDLEGMWILTYIVQGEETDSITAQGTADDLLVVFTMDDENAITATRASLPGHLCDRAGNRVVVTGDTTLTLPALEHAGRLRDFLVRLAISGSTVPTITFAAPTGETITYETDGDEFPVPDAEGTWLYSFTETAASVFAVALKSVSVVTQGGV